jgi:two-component system, NarL family, invasion response regulator UvrY
MIKVLIIEDSELLQERMQFLLSDIEGIQILGQSGSAVNGVIMIRELHPDAVILDLCLPDGSGIDVLKNIRSKQPELTVIMLTSFPYPHYRKSSLENGADYFLDKAMDFEKVPEIIKGLVKDQRINQAN